MRTTFIVCTLLCSVPGLAQDGVLWTTTIGTSGSDVARDAARADDGGFLVAGTTHSAANRQSDLYLVRIDPQGVPLWERTHGGSGWQSAHGAAATSDGGFVVTGYTTATSGDGTRDLLLVKVDSGGALQWTRSFGGDDADVGWSVIETSDGGLAVCGTSRTTGNGESKMILIRTDSEGRERWTRSFGGSLDDDGRSVVETADGGFLLSGATGSFGNGNRDVWVLRTDAEGEELWSEAVGASSAFDWGNCAVETSDGGAFAVGHGDVHGSELLNMLVVWIDNEGDLAWQRRLGEALYDYGTGCFATDDGEFLAVGVSKSAETLTNSGAAVLVDDRGRELWRERLDGDGSLWIESVEATDDGYLLVGTLRAAANGDHDVWLGKISDITPRFQPSATAGVAPFEVHFEDLSTGSVTGWAWDFDGDGITDSTEQNPTWTYLKAGVYSVNLEVSAGAASRSVAHENLIDVATNPRAPRRPSGRRGY